LRQPIHDSGPLGKLLLLRSADNRERFCRAYVTARNYSGSGVDWPSLRPIGPSVEVFGYPAEAMLIDTSEGHFTDLDNDGKLDRIVTSELHSGGDDRILLGVLPQDAPDDVAYTMLSKITFAGNDEIRALRGDGYKIFAGDQTAFHSVSSVFLEAFRYQDASWLHAALAPSLTAAEIAIDPKSADTSTDLILKPTPEGGLQEICAFRQTPRL
jgi:hypothetical protein